ncbi:MAG: DMT family transporter [Comamonadaceae bacterium]|nr:MAG: DMT family transporter [Comamonadaceae bacterium]
MRCVAGRSGPAGGPRGRQGVDAVSQSSEAGKLAGSRHGAMAMVAAMGFWAGNDALVKACSGHLSTGQILAVRGVFAVALALFLLILSRQGLEFRLLMRRDVVLRCAMEFATAASSTLALSLAPLSMVTALAMTAPLLAVIGALLLGWEPRRWLRLMAVGIGMAGALLVVQPWRSQPAPVLGVAAAIGCAVCLAARDLSTRRLANLLTARQLTVATSTSVWIAGAVMWAVSPQGSAVAGHHLALLALAALCATAGNLLLVHALMRGDVDRVMPLRFTLLLWSALLGLVVWNERPSTVAWCGLALVAAAGVLAMRTQQPTAR